EFHKVRQQYVSIEECRFRDNLNVFISHYTKVLIASEKSSVDLNESFQKNHNGITWSEKTFNSIRSKSLIYFYGDFKRLSCELDMFMPFKKDKVYCRFSNNCLNKELLEDDYKIEVKLVKENVDFKKFSERSSKNQVLISNTRFEKKEIPMVYEGNAVFAYSQNQDKQKEIKLLASSYEIIKVVIIPYLIWLYDQNQFEYITNLNYMSILCTKLLNNFLQIKLPEENNRSRVFNDLISTNAKFIKFNGKWVLLEERVVMPVDLFE
ncbi:hypothetical protein, partial [Clostridium sp.]|uniref:hypothetical protein n=1 Tax=Clostridium sp. TaxID=1506 RepID=UPI001A3D0019